MLSAQELFAQRGLRSDHQNFPLIVQHFSASRAGPDEVSRRFPVKCQFHEGTDINGFADAEFARVQLFERGNGVLNFRRLPGLSTGQIGGFESAGVVFVFGLALLVRGLGALGLGRAEINLQFVRQPGDDFLDERAFVHGRAIRTLQLRLRLPGWQRIGGRSCCVRC